MRFTALIAVIFLAGISPVWACPGPPLHETSFLKTLPQEAANKDVIALVEIVSVQTENYKNHIQMRVVEALKDTEQDEILTINAPQNSCNEDHLITIGDTYFVAGSRNEEGDFVGTWKGAEYDPRMN